MFKKVLTFFFARRKITTDDIEDSAVTISKLKGYDPSSNTLCYDSCIKLRGVLELQPPGLSKISAIYFWNTEGTTPIRAEINAFANRIALVLKNYDTFTVEDENLDAFAEFWKTNSFIILGKPGAGAKIAAQWDPDTGKPTIMQFGNSTSSDVIGTFRESFRIREDNADLQIHDGRALDFADPDDNIDCQIYRIGTKALRTNSELNFLRGSGFDKIISSVVSGDSYERFHIRADGLIRFGPGSADLDTAIQRQGAATLAFGDKDLTSGATLIPGADNSGSIGTDSKRWALVRAVTVTQGDIGFGPEDQPCPICGEKFKEGDIVVLKVTKVLESGEFRAKPVHLKCALER